jgi:hypothetical protein
VQRTGPPVLLILLLSTCAEEVRAPRRAQVAAPAVTGRYVLLRIDGRRLPVTLCGRNAEVSAGSLLLRAGHTFVASLTVNYSPTAPGQVYQATGTYQKPAGTNRITFQPAHSPSLTWSGTILETDGSIRIPYSACGETHTARLFRVN